MLDFATYLMFQAIVIFFFYFITSWRNFDHPNAELKVLWVEKIGVSLFWCNIFWRNIILAVQKIWWILIHQIMLPRVILYHITGTLL